MQRPARVQASADTGRKRAMNSENPDVSARNEEEQMRTIVIPVVCLLLGLASGYMVATATVSTTVTPAMIEQGIRENPRMLLDLLQQHPVEVFDLVVKGQEIKRNQARDEQILAQLLDPAEVEYAEDRASRGNPEAPITIIEFSDFQCPHCARAGEAVKQVVEENPERVKLVFLHLPLSSHKMAPLAAAYYEAVALQDVDKAWKFHDILFKNQDKLGKEGAEFLREAAASLEVNMDQLDEDLKGTEVRDRLQADAQAANKLGLRGTPTYVINGVVISGALPKEDFKEVIALIEEHGQDAPQAAAEETQAPEASAPQEQSAAEQAAQPAQ